MRKLSLIILLATLAASFSLVAPSPHGSDFKLSCSLCHSTSGWTYDKATSIFDHGTTAFALEASHAEISCRSCHPSLVFSEAKSKSKCIDCHTDMHEQSLGTECDRCHTPKSWVVGNMRELHSRTRFPLVGKHAVADCYQCHSTASLLRFDPMGIECYDCHSKDYTATTNPNHLQGGFSKNCSDCHLASRFGWTGVNINHSFFPLTLGHNISDCGKCHTNGSYANTPNTCAGCHMSNYNSTSNPNHQLTDFSTNCIQCHTTNPGWKPAEFRDHDARFFPIYSGNHEGEWNACSDCHTNSSNYASFSCIDCHEHSNQTEVNNSHDGVGGYVYSSDACYQCHPQGSKEGGFNHNTSNFPLTGAHLTTACNKCHSQGYAGTTTVCSDCHIGNYNQSSNPNHVSANIPTTCSTCHTTAPGWKPATFPIHNEYYALTGAHATIATDCNSCHNSNYASTPNTCAGCHIANYNQTSNPNHVELNLSNECATCHTTNPGWKPATFAVHNTYYVLEGKHTTLSCSDCHSNSYSNTPNTCAGCHINNYNQTSNPNHLTAQFSTECASCHSQNAWIPSTFDHDNQYFPIYSGKHAGEWTLCSECHTNPADYSVFSCIDCHEHNKPSTDDQHSGVGGYLYTSEACYACHPTGQSLGAFNHTTSPFPLTGGHQSVNCSACHTNGYSNTSPVCADCHMGNYNQSANPNHSAIGIPTDCAGCHTTAPGWKPAAFPIHGNYYALTGAHLTIASNCVDCHNGNYTNTPNTCAGCHINNYNVTTNPNHSAIGIPTECATCHTTNPGWTPASFPIHNNYYVLAGAHVSLPCTSCHNGNYTNIPNTCVGCHLNDYNQTTNPPHASAQFPTECQTCHTQTSWVPSTFNHDGQYFPIYSGSHNGEWNQCSDCHTNPSNYAVYTCTTSCHPQSSTNNAHQGVSGYTYTSTACLQCHPNGSAGDKMFRINQSKQD